MAAIWLEFEAIPDIEPPPTDPGSIIPGAGAPERRNAVTGVLESIPGPLEPSC